MATLKALRNRIKSVKSTQKITKAMKMVAASKLRRAKEAAESARPYAEAMEKMLSSMAAGAASSGNAPKLLSGSGHEEKHLIVVATSDRGLCGGFNSTIVRAARRRIRELRNNGKQVSILCIGAKGYDQLRGEFGSLIHEKVTNLSRRKLSYSDAEDIAKQLISTFNSGDADVITIVYNKFKSAISQIVTFQQLIPLQTEESVGQSATPGTPYDYEPGEEEVLTELLPQNVGVQVYRALLENAASEQGARMTAMDNATRNAGEMIKKLTLSYNRSRQAAITKELIEIISGAEAV